MSNDLRTRLAQLKELLDDGLISAADFEQRKQALLDGALGPPASASLPNPLAGATQMSVPTPGNPPAGALAGATVAGPSRLPSQIGSYRVLALVGAGGMGTVVRARHLEEGWAVQQGGDVAIKLIHPHIAETPEFRSRFLSEAALGRRVQHPGLVPTWDVIAEGPWLGTVMGFVEGETLTSRIRPGGLPADEVLALLDPIGETLDYLHAQGIVHRDIKPGNILIPPDGRPVVLDLGIAKDSRSTSSQTQAMTAMGTSAWMAPEQADAKHVDGAADRYALGLVAYALLSGRMPWGEEETELRVLTNKMMGQLASLSKVKEGISPTVAAAVMRMLSVAPGERFGSCGAFAEGLRGVSTGSASSDFTSPNVGLMKFIPAGTFTMGAPLSESGRIRNETPHQVTLTRPFWLMATPVTQAQYEAVTGENPSEFKGDGRRPVENVSWFDAVRFCNALSQREGLKAAYTIGAGDEPTVARVVGANGYRLPTEAEWEYAARAGEPYIYAGSNDLAEVGWVDSNSDGETHPVGGKRPNAWGLYDMSGNVFEWVWDVYGDYPAGQAVDPIGVSSGPDRVLRGGSWYNTADVARVADRNRNDPGDRYDILGLRLSRTVP